MPKEQTTEQELDEILLDFKQATKANIKAKENLVNCQLEIRKTHSEMLRASGRLHGLLIDSF